MKITDFATQFSRSLKLIDLKTGAESMNPSVVTKLGADMQPKQYGIAGSVVEYALPEEAIVVEQYYDEVDGLGRKLFPGDVIYLLSDVEDFATGRLTIIQNTMSFANLLDYKTKEPIPNTLTDFQKSICVGNVLYTETELQNNVDRLFTGAKPKFKDVSDDVRHLKGG